MKLKKTVNDPMNVSGCVILLVAVSTLERQESLGGEVEVASGAAWRVWRWLPSSNQTWQRNIPYEWKSFVEHHL